MMMSNEHLSRCEATESEEEKAPKMNNALMFHRRAVTNSNWVKRLNVFSVIFTAAGIVSFLLFVSLNLAAMGKQHDPEPTSPQTGKPLGPEEIKGMPLPSHLIPKPQQPSSPTSPDRDNTPAPKPSK